MQFLHILKLTEEMAQTLGNPKGKVTPAFAFKPRSPASSAVSPPACFMAKARYWCLSAECWCLWLMAINHFLGKSSVEAGVG